MNDSYQIALEYLQNRKKKRLGLLSNQTAYSHIEDRYLFELLYENGGLLKRLFLPEHGLFAELQDQVSLTDAGVYEDLNLQGVEIVSLYGDHEQSLIASEEHLRDLDAILVDIQDVGSRYYTFATTLSYLIEVLTENKIHLEIILIDRPNPAGSQVEGTLLPPSMESFVGKPGLPHRHGLTMGELALFYREQAESDLPLTIITFRKDSFKTGFISDHVQILSGNLAGADLDAWSISPSPNMPGPLTPLVYSGQCLLEGTNLSEGRGTTRPFELFGAPWLNRIFQKQMRKELKAPGVSIRPVKFIPSFHKYRGEVCNGFQLLPTGQDYHSLRHTLRILRFLKELHEAFQWRKGPYEFRSDRPAIELLAGDPLLMDFLEGRVPLSMVDEKLIEEETIWITTASRYRIYEHPLRRIENWNSQ